jgi:hypothetical protein
LALLDVDTVHPLRQPFNLDAPSLSHLGHLNSGSRDRRSDFDGGHDDAGVLLQLQMLPPIAEGPAV